MASDSQRNTSANYNSPSGTHTFKIPVDAPCKAKPTTSERTAYLSALRATTKQLQADVNKFLTDKMEEDKAKSGTGKKQDELEEQNYGEEQAEED
jgi:hypothetical protein